MSNEYTRELEVAIAAVADAARVCRAVQSQIEPATLEKKDKSPVTVADFASQAVVCKAIREAFDADPIIGEEDAAELREDGNAALREKVVANVGSIHPGASTDDVCGWIDAGGASDYSPRFWTLDPIDGTKGFLRKEQYAIALALIVDGHIVVSALGCPNLEGGTIYTAIAGQGAHIRAIEDDGTVGNPAPISVTDTTNASAMRFCESVESGHSSHSDSEQIAAALGITGEPVRMDSQCKYATVAAGRADSYLRLPTRPGYVERIWDHAAGVGVLTEAGGRATDVDGNDLDFTHGAGLEKNRGVIVTNGKLHDAVVAAVKAQLAK